MWCAYFRSVLLSVSLRVVGCNLVSPPEYWSERVTGQLWTFKRVVIVLWTADLVRFHVNQFDHLFVFAQFNYSVTVDRVIFYATFTFIRIKHVSSQYSHRVICCIWFWYLIMLIMPNSHRIHGCGMIMNRPWHHSLLQWCHIRCFQCH